MLFPEGERKDGPIVQPLFDGAAYVAAKAGVPIIPIGIGGSERAMPKARQDASIPAKVYVVIGASRSHGVDRVGDDVRRRSAIASRQPTVELSRRARSALLRHRSRSDVAQTRSTGSACRAAAR